jgi:hypothetical protein
MTAGVAENRSCRSFLLAAIALGLSAAACSGIDHATLDGVTTMPDDSTLTNAGGAMHTGIATGFKPRVWTHDIWGAHEESSGIDVQTSNANVVRVAHVANDPRVVVWAAGSGEAVLTVTLNGEPAMNVAIQVTEPAD